MSQSQAYLLKLSFSTENEGGGSMTLDVVVNPQDGSLSGSADGHILEGTEFSPNFNAHVAGHMHSTGLGNVTKVGAVSGQAAVSFPPPAIGTYLAPMTASFAVDNEFNGTGAFSVGKDTYQCKVCLA